MREPLVASPAGDSEIAAARRLDAAVRELTGHEALPDAVWRSLAAPSDASALVLDDEPDATRSVVHVAPSDTFTAQHWQVAIAAGASASATRIHAQLAVALHFVADHGGADATLWVPGADDTTDRLVAPAGFELVREQFQMRVALPVDDPPRWPSGVTTRPYRGGDDERAWLTVNNRAFANHPDQGAWVEATMQRRMAEPWFDSAGLLLAFDDRGLAGSCWTKVHPATPHDPRMGEIYVIGVDPDRQGTGLGRALVLAGLHHLAADRACPVGMLYVDAANAPAVTLYESLGFTVHRADRAYLAPAPGQPENSAMSDTPA